MSNLFGIRIQVAAFHCSFSAKAIFSVCSIGLLCPSVSVSASLTFPALHRIAAEFVLVERFATVLCNFVSDVFERAADLQCSFVSGTFSYFSAYGLQIQAIASSHTIQFKVKFNATSPRIEKMAIMKSILHIRYAAGRI